MQGLAAPARMCRVNAFCKRSGRLTFSELFDGTGGFAGRQMLNIAQELKSRRPVPSELGADIVQMEERTPAHHFVAIMAPLDPQQTMLVTVDSRGRFDGLLALAVLEFVRARAANLDFARPVSVLEGFHHENSGFDAVAVLPPASHTRFTAQSFKVQEKTLVALPMYRCELSGEESAEEIQFIRKHFWPSLDWDRAPAPQVRMRYENVRTRSRTRGSQPGLASMETLMREVQNLKGSPGSYVEVRNFKGEQLRITSTGEQLALEAEPAPGTIHIAADDRCSWVKRFIQDGLQAMAADLTPSSR